MAIFTFAVPPGNPVGEGISYTDFTRFGDFETITMTGTQIKLTGGIAGTGQIIGSNYSIKLHGSNSEFLTGEINTLKLSAAGTTYLNITGLNLSLPIFASHLQLGDDVGLVNYILSGNDKMTLTALNDTMFGGAGNDQIFGLGGHDAIAGDQGNDRLFGGGGSDTIYAGNGKDYSAGGNGNDFIFSGAGSDRVFGGAGTDTLTGEQGKDVLTGGAGADTFTFFDLPNANSVDKITDFVSGQDHIGLDPASFGVAIGPIAASAFRLGTAAQDANDRFIYQKSTGTLLFDADGNGAGAAIHFATLVPGTTLVASDIVGIIFF